MIRLNINGKVHQFDDDESMPLLWALRDVLNYTGTKYGCGKGLCGACTVHIDGQAMRSCITPVAFAANKKITTIEGLDPDNNHELQISWREYKVPQCGYCQAGQIMNAAAMLKTIPQATDEDIDNAMQGNICRCGTYKRIKQAIKHAADLQTENKG